MHKIISKVKMIYTKYFINQFKNIRFKNKLFISYIIIIIIPISVLGVYSYFQAKQFLMEQEKQGLTESVRQISENINYRFNNYNTIISSFAYNNQIIQIINDRDATYFDKYISFSSVLDPFVNTILYTNNDIERIQIYTDNENLDERANSIVLMDRIENEPWFDMVFEKRTLHWILHDNGLTGFLRFPEPTKDSPVNLLGVDLKYDKIFDFEIKKIEKYGILIMDDESNTIFQKNTIGEKEPVNAEKLANWNQSDYIKADNEEFFIIKNEIESTGWHFFYFSPVSYVQIDANRILRATAVIILVCLAILMVLIWLFSNTFVKRIYRLNEKMEAVEKGNLKLEISSNSKDEIGDLTNNFGKMLTQINTLIDNVYDTQVKQKDAELKSLQSQINPHFLYNTLSLINWKAISIDAMEISKITTNVSKFYRIMLSKGENIIPIKDEINSIKLYIEIQLALHNNSFDVEYNICEEILEYNIIKIVLQPIVENAIEHGIDEMKEGKGKIIIKGYEEEENILFDIKDNGPGIATEKIDSVLSKESSGYGLKNVNERIRIFYGSEYGIYITSKTGKGTCVNLKIPKNKLS